jgi:splicing factor U2AF subunit
VLRVRRPNDFKPELVPKNLPPPPDVNLGALGIVSTTVSDGPSKVFVGGLPYHLSDDDVKELLMAFGPLKSFHLVRDAGSVTSKGYAFCEYYDPKTTQAAINGLNNMPIGRYLNADTSIDFKITFDSLSVLVVRGED